MNAPAARRFSVQGGSHPRLGAAADRFLQRLLSVTYGRNRVYRLDSAYSHGRMTAMTDRIGRGEPVYLAGIGASGHNAGVALIEASSANGIRLLCNNEEERFAGIKHYQGYPSESIEALRAQLDSRNLTFDDIHAWVASWDYVRGAAFGVATALEEAPAGLHLLRPASCPPMNRTHFQQATEAPRRLAQQLGQKERVPIIGMRHHDNHAYFSYGVSPFAKSRDPVLVTVLDGFGDDGSISLYVARDTRLELLYSNRSMFDSLGLLYSVISSTQGGWTTLSSEGRYMGAAAWGDGNRLSNPYYPRLRQILSLEANGQIYLNRALANWQRMGEIQPYQKALVEILGPPVPPKDQWNPDAVLNVDDVRHPEQTRAKVDKAAALQLVFEDALFHVVGHLIRTVGSDKLVLTGGTALNGVANMRLLEHFDEEYYARYLGRKNTRLHLWVPPTPGDAGAPIGAAYAFASKSGVPFGEPLQHAFYCGSPPTNAEILAALGAHSDMAYCSLGDGSDAWQQSLVADLIAYIVSRDGVLGVFHGAAETGPRALGHRSIIANPCNPRTMEVLNLRVKYRERIRPLAPMVTYESADRWFELSDGASDDCHNAYNYMVLTTRAKPQSHRVIPAVIHRDGTARIQIVRRETHPFLHQYLQAMGRRVGAEVSVNTSLNVGSPIVQTPTQALEALRRSKGMDGLVFIGAEGGIFIAWHGIRDEVKDSGCRLRGWIRDWKTEVGASGIGGCGE